MKNLLFLLSLSFLVLFSCSSDDVSDVSNPNVNSSIVPTKVVNTFPDDDYYPDDYTIYYTYNGNKLDKVMDEYGNYDKATYTGDLITRSDSFNSDNLPTGDFAIYIYSNNKLVQIDYYNLNVLDSIRYFVYNSDGSVFEIPADSNGDSTNYVWFKNFYDASGNLIKREDIFGDQINSIYYFTHDDKNNPFINVIGYNTIRQPQNSRNNIITSSSNGSISNRDYTYNSYGFPTSINIDDIFNIEYFYNNVDE